MQVVPFRQALAVAANAAAEQLFVYSVSLLLHLTILSSNAAGVHSSTVTERGRHNLPLFHAIELSIARDLDLGLRQANLRLSAG